MAYDVASLCSPNKVNPSGIYVRQNQARMLISKHFDCFQITVRFQNPRAVQFRARNWAMNPDILLCIGKASLLEEYTKGIPHKTCDSISRHSGVAVEFAYARALQTSTKPGQETCITLDAELYNSAKRGDSKNYVNEMGSS